MMEADYFSDNGSYYKAANTALINTNLFSKTTLDPNSDYNYSIVDNYYGFKAIANPLLRSRVASMSYSARSRLKFNLVSKVAALTLR